MTTTKIEWCDISWNPTTGCTKVSEGCKNCYAERIAKRFWGDRKFTDVQCHEDRLCQPFRWKKPARVFVDSMSDLFHEDVPDSFIEFVFKRILLSNQHIYMILTKRPKRMREFVNRFCSYNDPTLCPEIIPNLWLGVSVENQQTADERIPLLLQTPAAVRFVSCEPMLGSVNLWRWLPESPVETLDWVIAGCESGTGARPMQLDWARSLRDQCQTAGVPFFLKQAVIDGKLVKMPELDGKIWNEFPEAMK